MATSKIEPARPAIDWVGSLSSVPLGEVIRRVAAEERSGDLQVQFGSAIKTIYFDRGFVVFAASNLKRDRLGESLIEAGRISRHEFAVASMLMKSSRRKFGQALVHAGVMSEEQLGREVGHQVNRIVLSIFKAKEGIYSFDERETIIPVNLKVSLSIYRILLQGIRFMTSGKLILAGLPPLNTTVRVSERPPFTLEPRKLKSLEQSLLKNAGNGLPLAALIRATDGDRGQTLRACYGLYAAGLLERIGSSRKKPLKVQEETGVFVLSEIQRKFGKIRATNARQEILMEFDRLDRATEKELLKLEGSSVDEEALRRAYEKRRSEWQKKRAMVEDQRTLVTKIDVIQKRLDKAYEQMLSEREAPEELEIDERSHPVLEAPTEKPLPPLNEDLFEEVGIEVTEFETLPPAESASLVDTQPPRARTGDEATGKEGNGDLEAREDPETREHDALDEAAAEKPTELRGAARMERVRQLLRDVKLHFQVRDWEHAVALLYELVELDPGVAGHHAMLGRAMARHPVMRKDAERHFIEAVRLAPQDADLHYSLGLYYKSFGMLSRAVNEFRTTLRIQPQHEGAQKHLGAAGRAGKDPLRDMFKKIFG